MNYPTLFPSEVAPDFYIKEEYKLERLYRTYSPERGCLKIEYGGDPWV